MQQHVEERSISRWMRVPDEDISRMVCTFIQNEYTRIGQVLQLYVVPPKVQLFRRLVVNFRESEVMRLAT
jgi:hypothetical protein